MCVRLVTGLIKGHSLAGEQPIGIIKEENVMDINRVAKDLSLIHIFIGIASAKSRSYEQGYQCLHLGYGVDKNVQAPTILTDAGIPVTLIGKVADIVANDKGTSISCVPTEACMAVSYTHLDVYKRQSGNVH